MILLHYTAMASAAEARDWLCNPASGVSAHYVLARDGTCWQLVSEGMRAWHAGPGAWGATTDVNSRSIGIEIVNTGSEPFPEPQMAALESLMTGIAARWSIPPERVVGHSDTALGRKIDPGPRFDWARLARRGLSIRPRPAAPGDFAADAERFGYRAAPGQDEIRLAAFRARFRPGAEGPEDETDRALMADLAARWPADGGRTLPAATAC
ncbi:N-acetylmuramoyl-L-alanine amidase [Salipiger sp.]|uniref:N-acetylmuramoyl-L-alanine amidase n=1 Tax=Salipiger sp. TaxID=2078585 RepID=UPI003A969AED